jgi:hypothetical protein
MIDLTDGPGLNRDVLVQATISERLEARKLNKYDFRVTAR